MNERKYYVHTIPARYLDQGAICQERFRSSGVADTPSYQLNTETFLQELSERYKLRDLANISEIKRILLKEERPILFTLESLSQFVPEDEEEIEKLNKDIAENLVLAREFFEKEMESSGLDGQTLLEKIDKGEEIEEGIQFAASQVQEYAWYLTLVNHRLVFSIAKEDRGWKVMTDEDRQDYLQDSLIAAWELACSYNPKRGRFSTYLYSAQTRKARIERSRSKDISVARYQNYIVPYIEAGRLLEDTSYADSPYMRELLASMLYDEIQGRLHFPRSRVLEALEEYVHKLHPNLFGSSGPIRAVRQGPAIQWENQYLNFKKTVKKRIKRMRAIINIDRPLSLDKKHNVQFRDSEGSIRHERLPMIDLITGTQDVSGKIEEQEFKEEIEKILALKLTGREQDAIKMKYGFDGRPKMTHAEIGKYLGVSKQRVSQIVDTAMEKLRSISIRRRLTDLR